MAKAKFHNNLIIATMLIVTFMASVEGTVVTTAMPTIVSRLGHVSQFTWVYGIFLRLALVNLEILLKFACSKHSHINMNQLEKENN